MELYEYQAKCLNMVLESLKPRKPDVPVMDVSSDCCFAPLDRVGDELYACSACGRLCSDGGSF